MLQPGQTGKAFGGNGKGVLEATLQLTPTPAAPLGQTLDPQGWLIVEALDQAIFRLRPLMVTLQLCQQEALQQGDLFLDCGARSELSQQLFSGIAP